MLGGGGGGGGGPPCVCPNIRAGDPCVSPHASRVKVPPTVYPLLRLVTYLPCAHI